MRAWRAQLGVRATSILSFALLALLVSAVLAGGTYLTARHFLLGQREDTAARQAFVDAALVREGLLTAGARVSDVLDSTSPPPGAVVVVERNGAWYASSLDAEADIVPARIRRLAAQGQAAQAWTRLGSEPAIVVGVPLPAVGARVYELSPTTELDDGGRRPPRKGRLVACRRTPGGRRVGGRGHCRRADDDPPARDLGPRPGRHRRVVQHHGGGARPAHAP